MSKQQEENGGKWDTYEVEGVGEWKSHSRDLHSQSTDCAHLIAVMFSRAPVFVSSFGLRAPHPLRVLVALVALVVALALSSALPAFLTPSGPRWGLGGCPCVTELSAQLLLQGFVSHVQVAFQCLGKALSERCLLLFFRGGVSSDVRITLPIHI
jgi:hypothetical protein